MPTMGVLLAVLILGPSVAAASAPPLTGTWRSAVEERLRVTVSTFSDGPSRIEVRVDTPEGRGSFWETLRRVTPNPRLVPSHKERDAQARLPLREGRKGAFEYRHRSMVHCRRAQLAQVILNDAQFFQHEREQSPVDRMQRRGCLQGIAQLLGRGAQARGGERCEGGRIGSPSASACRSPDPCGASRCARAVARRRAQSSR